MKRLLFYLLVLALIAGIVWLFVGTPVTDEQTSPPPAKSEPQTAEAEPESTHSDTASIPTGEGQTKEAKPSIITLQELYQQDKER